MQRMRRGGAAVAVALMLFVAAAHAAPKQKKAEKTIFARGRAITAIVVLLDETGKPAGHGAGVIVEEDDASPWRYTILTAAHVVAQAEGQYQVRLHQEDPFAPLYRFPAKVLQRDTEFDLATLEIESYVRFPVAALAEKRPEMDEQVICLGAPLARHIQVATGRYQGRPRQTPLKDAYSVPVCFGSSGGPVLTMEGKLVGISAQMRIAGFPAWSHNMLAVTIEDIRAFLAPQLRKIL